MPVLDKSEWEDMREHVADVFWELCDSTLIVRYDKNSEFDPEFGHRTFTDLREVKLPYTEIGSAGRFKDLEPSGADFKTNVRFRCYIPSLMIEKFVPGGKIQREKHIIVINDIEWQIEAVIPYHMQHGNSMMHKLHLTHKEPAEQPQGAYGG